MTLVEKLRAAQAKTGSMLCVGLDPVLGKLPPHLVKEFGDRIQPLYYQVLTSIVRTTAQFACAFKPNSAFYEAKGPDGILALEKICAFIKSNFPDHLLVLDGKRGDIGDTAIMYAEMYLRYHPDAVTVNPYLGTDTAKPYIDAGLGIFVLGCTTNPGAAQIQKLNAISSRFPCGGRPVYIHAVDTFIDAFGRTGQLGFVAGATHLEELGAIRKLVGPDIPLLIPGIGKQQGDLAGTLRNNDGGLAVINVSSKVCHASSGPDFAEAAGGAAESYNGQVNSLRQLKE